VRSHRKAGRGGDGTFVPGTPVAVRVNLCESLAVLHIIACRRSQLGGPPRPLQMFRLMNARRLRLDYGYKSPDKPLPAGPPPSTLVSIGNLLYCELLPIYYI
jgi:hypothetical protein